MSSLDRPKLQATPEAWQVFGDSLQQQGDPRGELIALWHAGDSEAVTSHVAKHAGALLGPAAAVADKLEINWRWCLAESMTVTIDSNDSKEAAAITKAALSSPIASELQAITIMARSSGFTDASGAVSALSELPSSCKSVELVDARARDSWMLVAREYYVEGRVSFGPLQSLWWLPLESVVIETAVADALELGTVSSDTLERLVIRGLLFAQPWTMLQNARLPELRELELRLGETYVANTPMQIRPYVEEEYYMVWHDEDDDEWRQMDEWGEHDEGLIDNDWREQIQPLLRSLSQSKLESLALTSFGSNERLLESILVGGLPATLRTLSFAHARLEPEDVDWMLENRDLFSGLERLDLTDTSLSPEDAARLEGVVPEIKHSHYAHAPRYRFVAGQE